MAIRSSSVWWRNLPLLRSHHLILPSLGRCLKLHQPTHPKLTKDDRTIETCIYIPSVDYSSSYGYQPPRISTPMSEGWVQTDHYSLFDYDAWGEDGDQGGYGDRFEDYMRWNYENFELRSFYMLVQDIDWIRTTYTTTNYVLSYPWFPYMLHTYPYTKLVL